MSKAKENTITFKDLNVANFLNYLSNADVGVPQVLDFKSDKLISRGHPETRTYVKSFQMNLSDLFKFDELPSNFERIKLHLTKLKGLKDNLDIFDKAGHEKVDGVFQYEKTGEDGVLLAHSIKFNSKDNKLKITTKSGDNTLISYMPDTAWKVFSDVENTFGKFDIDSKFISQLTRLTKLDSSEVSDNAKSKEVSIVIWISPDGKIEFTSKVADKWSIEYPGGNKKIEVKADQQNFDGKLVLYVPMRIIEAMTLDFYTVYVTFNKNINYHTIVLWRSEDDVYISGVLKYDPNKK